MVIQTESQSQLEIISSQGYSPAGRLPAELLIKIFCAYLPLDRHIPLRNLSNVNIWRLSWVCTWWRAVIVSNSMLWSNFDIESIEGMNVTAKERMHRRILSCLERSDTLLISFRFRACASSSLECLKELSNASRRWEHVSIFVTNLYDIPLNAFVFSVYRRLPNLQSLEIIGLRTHFFADDAAFIVFSHAPNLSHLTLHHLKFPIMYTRMPLSQITHLTLISPGFSWDEFPAFLSTLPLLTEFTWSGHPRCIGNTNQLAKITVPKLRVADVRYGGQSGTYSVLDCMLAPQLATLRISCGYFIQVPDYDILEISVAGLFASSSCSMLEELSLSRFPASLVPKFVANLAFIKELTIDDISDIGNNASELVQALFPRDLKESLILQRAGCLIIENYDVDRIQFIEEMTKRNFGFKPVIRFYNKTIVIKSP